MHLKDALPQVGAPDPELKNSPIVDHSEYDDRDAMSDVELECAERGVWVRMGEKRNEK